MIFDFFPDKPFATRHDLVANGDTIRSFIDTGRGGAQPRWVEYPDHQGTLTPVTDPERVRKALFWGRA